MTAYSIDMSTFDSRQWDHWTVPEIAVVDGLETAYRRGGTGETILYLHGGGNTRAWLPFHQAMADEFDFIAPEHPGFGDSPRPSRFTTWEDMILHYDGFFRALGLDRIHLVGNSLGALLAAKIAVAAIEHPFISPRVPFSLAAVGARNGRRDFYFLVEIKVLLFDGKRLLTVLAGFGFWVHGTSM